MLLIVACHIEVQYVPRKRKARQCIIVMYVTINIHRIRSVLHLKGNKFS